jgi:hypothetical protein
MKQGKSPAKARNGRPTSRTEDGHERAQPDGSVMVQAHADAVAAAVKAVPDAAKSDLAAAALQAVPDADKAGTVASALDAVPDAAKADVATAALQAVPDADMAGVAAAAAQAAPDAAKPTIAAAAVDGAPDANKADVAVAAVHALPDADKAEVTTAMADRLPASDQDALLDRLGGPDQAVTNAIWKWTVGTFAVVLLAATVALVGALFISFWRKVDTTLVQMLLTIFTTVAGILAGFVSGRASTAKPRRA